MRKICCSALFVSALLSVAHVATGASDEGAEVAANSAGSPKAANPETAVDVSGLKSGCFYARDVNNWVALNRDYLIAYAPNNNRAFLVRFAPPSIALRSASTIGFAGRDRICGKPGERLIVGEGLGGGRPDYIILDVWRLDAAAVEQLVENKKSRDAPGVEAVGGSPGAVIETDIKVDGDGANADGDVAGSD